MFILPLSELLLICEDAVGWLQLSPEWGSVAAKERKGTAKYNHTGDFSHGCATLGMVQLLKTLRLTSVKGTRLKLQWHSFLAGCCQSYSNTALSLMRYTAYYRPCYREPAALLWVYLNGEVEMKKHFKVYRYSILTSCFPAFSLSE